MKVGITGHQHFADLTVLPWVRECIRRRLSSFSELCGLSSLAKGADQLFAQIVLELGGNLEAVLPFAGYEDTFEDAQDAICFRELLAECITVTTLTFDRTREQSYLGAGQYIADHSELLIAVWDGKPAAGLGGTGDVVSYALRGGRDVYQVNPVTRTTFHRSNAG
jgi:hypothetical protein